MVLFYTNKIKNGQAYFDVNESRHIVSALRKSVGEEINFLDGIGNQYRGEITDLSKKHVSAKVVFMETQADKRLYSSHIAIAPTKNIDRLEWFVEKSIEIGIDQISFILCKHSERKVIKMERLERIALSAMKQSMNIRLPILNPLINFENFVKDCQADQKLIAAVPENELHFNKLTTNQGSICCLIGPEGGFRESEIMIAQNHGFQTVSLGDRRLRTETAGIVTAMYAHEKLKITL